MAIGTTKPSEMVNLVPVARSTLVQSVADQLLALIMEGHLPPGSRLPSERELIKRLGVGRSTIREALRSLAAMNLVELRPGQGAFVIDMGVQTVIRPELLTALLNRSVTMDLLETRTLLEPAAVELAAHRATAEELTDLAAILEHCTAAHVNGEHTAALSAEFHVALARCTHNEVLVMLMQSILGLLEERGERLERVAGFTDWELASHREILDALRARDGRRARRLMSVHLKSSTAALLKGALEDDTE